MPTPPTRSTVDKPRVVYVHGNRTMRWSTAWAPWLRDELAALGFETVFETFPDSIAARREYWLPFLRDHLAVGEDDVLLGWSSGAVAALRHLEEHRLRGAVLVSPYTSLDDELERASGYFDQPWNWEAIRANAGSAAVFWGSDDPFIPREQFTFVVDALDATSFEILGGGHFEHRTEFPELLEYLRTTYS
ncbi:hypothetical protein LX15_001500 [Streptoalloteichus tenebrarius]|uniref:Retinoblastoma-binding protein 9 n=1 Tax=Streptoalloteichus tenebrarius (strain ATCC 17920 / DSM 40477 / JCM 4838 / CBS 697.72 / NBRC 16177 / NCIMB 11028 / NRRL B-12390 / A12253. 1 / ISP 5477) TaxID=1933 RepID=A0ABT1HQL7_STRSD|nr:alpha/beta hydrolase [Streptoalloteichus tenebrarius]MCP2257814.1 hypothetical protein [Streptoalloteichus tenebrarius]BFE99821.1 hypothetical protein GCM10020241_14970 [Streptoalloteichus tenebrarius]